MIVNKCQLCGILRNGWEGELPDCITQLRILKRQDGISPFILYQCPECEAYYLQHTSQEWDSFKESMVTVQKLYPDDNEEAQKRMHPVQSGSHYATINSSGRCSGCDSVDIVKLYDTKIGDSVLVWCKCNECGKEEFMDSYEDEY